MARCRAALIAGWLVGASLVSSPAVAQSETPSEPTSPPEETVEQTGDETGPSDQPRAGAQKEAIAEDLFKRGLEALDEEQYEEACRLLEQSLRLDVAPGTLWQLSQCREKLGQLASAWAAARRLEGLSNRRGEAQRAAVARERAEALEPRLSRVLVTVDEKASVEGLELALDGQRFNPNAWNSPLPIDLGSHVIKATAPGRLPWTHEFSVEEERSTIRVRLPELELAPVPKRPPGSEMPVDEPWYENTLGWGLTGAAVVFAGAAVALFFYSLDLEDQAGERGLDLADREALLSDADLARALFITSAALAGVSLGGAALVFTGVF